MSKQIAVRLPDELVDFIDGLIAGGDFQSRASIVTSELRRMKRRIEAERDAEIYRREGEDAELDGLSGYASHLPMDID